MASGKATSHYRDNMIHGQVVWVHFFAAIVALAGSKNILPPLGSAKLACFGLFSLYMFVAGRLKEAAAKVDIVHLTHLPKFCWNHVDLQLDAV